MTDFTIEVQITDERDTETTEQKDEQTDNQSDDGIDFDQICDALGISKAQATIWTVVAVITLLAIVVVAL